MKAHDGISKAEEEHEHQGNQKVGDRPGQRRHRHALFRVLEIVHIHRHRLCPANVKHQKHQKAHHVQMLEGVEGEPAPILRGIVAQLIGHEAVAQLVQGDAQKRRDQPKQDAENIGKIKSVPYGL